MVEKRKQKSQLDKFKDAAREHATDDSEEAFDEALKKVGSVKPSKDDKTED